MAVPWAEGKGQGCRGSCGCPNLEVAGISRPQLGRALGRLHKSCCKGPHSLICPPPVRVVVGASLPQFSYLHYPAWNPLCLLGLGLCAVTSALRQGSSEHLCLTGLGVWSSPTNP